jgi:hypothetical protein
VDAGKKRLALASLLVIAGGAVWWVVQHYDTKSAKTAVTTTPVQPGKLRVTLTPVGGISIPLGETLSVNSEVAASDGLLGTSDCVMSWNDEVRGNSVFRDRTGCDATFEYASVAQTGTHHITARAQGRAGGHGNGTGSVDVYVSS